MPTKNENSVAAGRLKPDGDDDGPGDCGVLGAASEHSFHANEQQTAHDKRDGDRPDLLGQGESGRLEHKPAHRSQAKGTGQLQQVIATGAIAPTEGELPQTFGEQRQHGQHGTDLDDDVEQIAARCQPPLGNQQMARRRDRQELGYALNNPQQNDFYPVRHAPCNREKRLDDKL